MVFTIEPWYYDYGNNFRIAAERIEQLPRSRFHVVEWNASGQFLIARNDDANPGDAGRWTRIDWMPLDGLAPYVWGFCMTAYRAAGGLQRIPVLASEACALTIECVRWPTDSVRDTLCHMQQNSGLTAIERGIPQGIFGGIIGLFFTGLLQGTGQLPQGALVLILGGVFLGGIAWGINYAVISGSARIATGVHMPSGDTTAYVPTFSHIEAIEIRGDLDGAAQAWADACVEHATNALVWVKAGEFHLRRRNDPATALVHYLKVRDLPGASSELVRYAHAKVIDLHLGPLADEGRALVELRRLIECFPGTREAEQARTTLARLKAERSGGADPA